MANIIEFVNKIGILKVVKTKMPIGFKIMLEDGDSYWCGPGYGDAFEGTSYQNSEDGGIFPICPNDAKKLYLMAQELLAMQK